MLTKLESPSPEVSDADRRSRRERRIHRHIGSGVDHTETIRSDDAHAATMGVEEQLALQSAAFCADLRESRRNHNEAFHRLARTGVNRFDAQRRGDREHREVDGTVDCLDRRCACQAEQRLDVGIDGIHGSLESAVDEVANDRMPNPARASSSADDRDGLRPEHSRDALHAGCPGATLGCGKRLSSWLDVE
jgi:hypothetical protein